MGDEETKNKHTKKTGQEQCAYTIGEEVHAIMITYAKEQDVEEVHKVSLVDEDVDEGTTLCTMSWIRNRKNVQPTSPEAISVLIQRK